MSENKIWQNYGHEFVASLFGPHCIFYRSVNITTPVCCPIVIRPHCMHRTSPFSFLRHLSTWHCSHLLLSAVLQPRAAAPLLLGARWTPLSIDISCPTAFSSKPAGRLGCGQMMGQTYRRTDRRTDSRTFHRPCFADYTGSVNNSTDGVGWFVGVLFCVGHDREPSKNDWTDRDAVWE